MVCFVSIAISITFIIHPYFFTLESIWIKCFTDQLRSDFLIFSQSGNPVPQMSHYGKVFLKKTFDNEVGGHFLNRRETRKSGEKEKFHGLMTSSVFSGLFEFMWFCFYFYLFCLNECSLLLYLEFISSHICLRTVKILVLKDMFAACQDRFPVRIQRTTAVGDRHFL